MTSTGFNIGMESDIRPSSKVLKPPGGGSSDIFGADAGGQPVRRNNRNQSQLQSSMFTDMMETKSKSARDSRRNPINHDGMTEADCCHSFSNNRRANWKPDGNPVTGEGYAIANGVKEIAATNGVAQPLASAPASAAAPKTNGSAQSAPPSRPGRVPPGGFSSGLW